MHLRLSGIIFIVVAPKYYEAVSELELLLGPEKHWVADYFVTCNGQEVGYRKAV